MSWVELPENFTSAVKKLRDMTLLREAPSRSYIRTVASNSLMKITPHYGQFLREMMPVAVYSFVKLCRFGGFLRETVYMSRLLDYAMAASPFLNYCPIAGQFLHVRTRTDTDTHATSSLCLRRCNYVSLLRKCYITANPSLQK